MELVAKVCNGCQKYFKPSESIHVVDERNAERFKVAVGIYHKGCCPLHGKPPQNT